MTQWRFGAAHGVIGTIRRGERRPTRGAEIPRVRRAPSGSPKPPCSACRCTSASWPSWCAAGAQTVSSEQLAELARVNAAKVRKDLSLLGSFGTRGSGYDPEFLIAQIDRALGVDENWSVAIVGIGNLGRALTNSAGFASRGCEVTALFDVDAAVVGEEIRGMKVRHMDEIATLRAAERPDIGVITTPGWAAQGVADLLVRAGVTSLLNFAPRVLDVPPTVHLRYVDLSIELQVLGFYRARQDELGRDGAAGAGHHAGAVIRSVGLSRGSDLA